MSNIITENVNSREIEPERVKAWVNLDGTGVINLRNSLNISSILDNGVGNYSIIYSNMFNGSPSPTGSAAQSGVRAVVDYASVGSVGVAGLNIISSNSITGTLLDANVVSSHILGELA